MYKTYKTAALGVCSVALIMLAGLPAGAQMSMNHVSATDRAFMAQASEGNLGEIAAGMLAEQRGRSTTVQMLGKRYVDNHQTNERNLRMLAARLGVDLPMHPSPAGRMEMQQLQGLSGRAFDAAFLRDEMRDHMRTIAAFKQEANGGGSPAVVAYARQSLPVLEEHLDLATDDATHMRGMANMDGGAMSGSNGMNTMNGSNGMNRSNSNQETGANTAPGPNTSNNGMSRSNSNQETGANTARVPNAISNGSSNTSSNNAGSDERTGQPTSSSPAPSMNH